MAIFGIGVLVSFLSCLSICLPVLLLAYLQLSDIICRLKPLHLYAKIGVLALCSGTGRSGLVVTRLPAAREDPGSRRAAGKSLCFHENHCDTQLWARAAH